MVRSYPEDSIFIIHLPPAFKHIFFFSEQSIDAENHFDLAELKNFEP